MKLANALSQRAELQTCIRQLEERLNNNAQVQEGEESAEDPMELLRELDEDYAQLEALIARINRTNSVTLVDGGPAVRPAGPPGLHDRPPGDPPRIFKRASAWSTAGRGRVQDPQHRQRPGAAKAGGSGCQGTPGAG